MRLTLTRHPFNMGVLIRLCVDRAGGKPIRDWGDLLQPCLKQRVAWIDSPREFVGAALKTLGGGFNTGAAELASLGLSDRTVAQQVDRLRQQVRVFAFPWSASRKGTSKCVQRSDTDPKRTLVCFFSPLEPKCSEQRRS